MRQDMRADKGSDIENLIAELEHLRGQDMLDACGDGPCKKEQIDVCITYAYRLLNMLNFRSYNSRFARYQINYNRTEDI